MRVLLDVYATDGHLHGSVSSPDDARSVQFSGVVELLAALEHLSDEEASGPAPEERQ